MYHHLHEFAQAYADMFDISIYIGHSAIIPASYMPHHISYLDRSVCVSFAVCLLNCNFHMSTIILICTANSAHVKFADDRSWEAVCACLDASMLNRGANRAAQSRKTAW